MFGEWLERMRRVEDWIREVIAIRSNRRMTMKAALQLSCEVLKGSLCAVLGFPTARTTIGSRFTEEKAEGRITVAIGRDKKPSDAEIAAVEKTVNETLSRDEKCYVFSMERKKAEETYGEAMYDKFEVAILFQDRKSSGWCRSRLKSPIYGWFISKDVYFIARLTRT